MTIGFNASTAFRQYRTGVEEHAFRLTEEFLKNRDHQFIVYGKDSHSFRWPDNCVYRQLKWRGPMWTQVRLAYELAVRRPQALLIPSHVLPLIHPRCSVVVVHGLEYEHFPETYPFARLRYLRFVTKNALKRSCRVIASSQSTKNDLVNFYGADDSKIDVVHLGFSEGFFNVKRKPYFLYVGRIESKKNISNLVKAFDLFKQRYHLDHKLILAGSPGYGYEKIRRGINELLFKDFILETGYVSEERKKMLFSEAQAFVFPSLYEGFGIPILEAQSARCPVITSNVSSMSEIGRGSFLVNPASVEEICEGMYKVVSDDELRNEMIEAGIVNSKMFSWERCAKETLKIVEKAYEDCSAA